MNKIKELRKKNGDTLKSLAEKINYDYSNLSKIERGIYAPSLTLLQRIANIYGVDIRYFIESKGEKEYTQAEQQFMQDLDIDSEELFKKYNLVLDDQKITQEEMEFIIDIIRKLRQTIQKYIQ
ncbi:helix-turn-helix domain-containing protein [Ectobacillus panaciterrae]|uniref:helix-turn-helix domain-containing protein n=1 Tax=Ectobacillus panaciterrae TaxID=363872 RepID=UPI000400D91C|nr:helix-turn-helix transcriptional regulator [Ectobacillus panaciterrae]